MSGASVGVADALSLGLADCMVAPESLMDVRAGLAAAAGGDDPQQGIVRLMEEHSIVAGKEMFSALADILPSEPPQSAEEFVARVAANPVLAELSQLFKSRSPTALTAIFHAHIEARKLMETGAVLKMDLRLAEYLAGLPDFAEGVRAVLVDKDNRPNWQPRDFRSVDGAAILSAVEGA
jgi:enoyl-CoA hydratase